MKHGTKPTKKQSILISSRKLDAKHWLVISDTSEKLVIRHRENGLIRNVYKERAI